MNAGAIAAPPGAGAADAAGRSDRLARQTGCGENRDRVRPSPPASRFRLFPLLQARPAALLALLLATFAFAAPAAAQTSVTLVKNLDGLLSTTPLADYDLLTQFTTGSSTEGYKLTGVVLYVLGAATSTVTFNVVILDSNQDSLGGEGGELTNPSSLTNGENTFTAPGNGIDLDANTNYHVWVEVTAQGNEEGRIGQTTDDDEDSGGAPGWSIANDGNERDWNVAPWTSSHLSLMFAIKGYAKDTTAPTLQSATVHGPTLTLEYDEGLDTDSTPATTDITVSVDGTDQNPSSVVVSDSAVTLTLGTAATSGQTVTVTYTAGTNPIQDLGGNDAGNLSAESVTNTTLPTPTIQLVRIVSAPTYDSNDDDRRDTYVQGDEILVDVEFLQPVRVTGDGDVELHLDLGADDTDQTNSRKTLTPPTVMHGGMTLRFAYTVLAADTDSDGVWVQTGTGNEVIHQPHKDDTSPQKVVHADGGIHADADVTKDGLPTAGAGAASSHAKVDGSKTAADTGPRPTGATVDGDTLTVTYNRSLATPTAEELTALTFHFSVQGVGGVGGGNRNAYQNPSKVAVDGTTVTLTLSQPARSGDKVTLRYQLIDNDGLKGAGVNGKLAPAFRDLAVTQSVVVNAPLPQRASIAGTKLELVFDQALEEGAEGTPSGSAFEVTAIDADDDLRTIPGTGTATVSGQYVTVTLAEAVGADELASVSYVETDGLQNPGGDEVQTFEGFHVGVYDVSPPEDVDGQAMQTASSPARSKVIAYFDEPLDTNSVPATGDFSLVVGGNAATASSVAVAGNAVTLTLNQALTGGAVVALGHRPGTNPIQDLAGNANGGVHACDKCLDVRRADAADVGGDGAGGGRRQPDADLRPASRSGQGAGSGEVHAALCAGRGRERPDRPGGIPVRRGPGCDGGQEGGAGVGRPGVPLRLGHGELRAGDRRAQPAGHRRPGSGGDLARGGDQQAGERVHEGTGGVGQQRRARSGQGGQEPDAEVPAQAGHGQGAQGVGVQPGGCVGRGGPGGRRRNVHGRRRRRGARAGPRAGPRRDGRGELHARWGRPRAVGHRGPPDRGLLRGEGCERRAVGPLGERVRGGGGRGQGGRAHGVAVGGEQ